MTRVTRRMLDGTIVLLLGLTALSYALAHVDLGAATMPVAVAIALVKVLLVLLVFMHLVEASPAVRVMVLVVPVFVVLLIGLIFGDARARVRPVEPPASPTEARGLRGDGRRLAVGLLPGRRLHHGLREVRDRELDEVDVR